MGDTKVIYLGSETTHYLDEEVREAMTNYWKEHASSTSLNEMMLDNNAEELHKEEFPEIMSYLPDFRGKRVIELGAGIGRFTSVLAETAENVVAVDFMQEFIDKNKEANSNFKNIEFQCADVTQLQKDSRCSDLVFSNWLLMYLEDGEVQALLKKLLEWLDEDGYLFVRESCHHSSGNKPRSENPTHYRDPQLYEAFFSSAVIPCGDSQSYGFDIVMSKSVDTYIKITSVAMEHRVTAVAPEFGVRFRGNVKMLYRLLGRLRKGNGNQFVWLWQKVRRNQTASHGYKTFQEFLDNQQYSTNGILRYERIFGRTFVSTGGLETTKEFVEQLDLQPGQVVLDVGCGIGGSGFYMAKEFKTKVIGIDLSSNMIQLAMERATEVEADPNLVVFEVADATKRNYQAESFDVIYSRDTILHIPDKLSLFKNFFKWLKPGGKVLISDYSCSDGEHSERFQAYVKQRGYALLSPRQYGKVLEEAGFVSVRAEDKTELFREVLRREVAFAEQIREDYIKEFSQKDYDDVVNGWNDKLDRTALGEQRWGLFYAVKP